MRIRVSRIMSIAVLIAFFKMSGQTITNVSPTRVTWESTVTITGTGFTSSLLSGISISGISINNKTLVNSETITFQINETNASNDTTSDPDPFGTDPRDRYNRVMTFNGGPTTYEFDFIAPTNRDHRNSGGTNNVPRITEIFTNMDGFSRFSDRNDIVDDKHELLGFTYGGVIYSTGVNDAVLQQGLDDDGLGETFVPQNFKAYSTNGVEGTTNGNHYLAAADSTDGLTGGPESNGTPASNYPELSGLSIYETLIDGINGLELGTGITNLNQNNTVRFFSGNGQVGALGNNVPDLLLTQIAQAGARDIYYYADIDGNVVGRPIRLFIVENQGNNEPLATNRWDFYRYQTGVSFDVAVPGTKQLGDNATRPLRMVAFKLEDFAIDTTNIGDINNINMSAGGRADLAFMAYNKAAFAIRSPFITSRPPSRFICELPSSEIITFEVGVTIDGEENNPGYVPSAQEALSFQWYKYNSEIDGTVPKMIGETTDNLTIDGTIEVIDTDDMGIYRMIVSNSFGAVIVPVTLNEGGTPATWTAGAWQLPPGFGPGPGEIAVLDKERSLRFEEDYNLLVDLEGCDCVVKAGADVVIPSGYSLKLFGSITVEDEIPAGTDIDGNPTPFVPAGTFLLEDNASLVQINDVAVNQNTGGVQMNRLAENVGDLDYIYWSSPTEGFELTTSNIPNSASFMWDVRAPNTTGTEGNWLPFNSEMELGRGYIARVPFSTPNFTTVFKGVPNNGLVSIPVFQTGDIIDNNSNTLPVEDRHWNLLGNPYPSAISAEKFLDNPVNAGILEGAVYVWDSDGSSFTDLNDAPFYENFITNYSDAYVVYNKTGSVPNTFSGNIAAGQGFFVKVLESANAAENVEFRNPMRYGASDNVLPNDEFLRNAPGNSSGQEKQLLWLNLVNAEDNNSSITLVGYANGATNDKDRLYDAYANRAERELSIHSLIDGNKMVIQGRALPFNDQDMVPMGVQIPEAGIFYIGIDQVKGSLFSNEDLPIIIEDTYLDQMHDLRESPYSFNAQVAGTYNDRFVLRYNANALSINEAPEEPDTFAYIKDHRLYIQSSAMISMVQVYDLSGKLVMDYKPERNMTRIETDFNFARGAYITLITLEESITVSKKLMN